MVSEMFMVHQRVAKCVETDNGWCRFVHIDTDGFVHIISAPASAATPIRTVMDPRCRWPESKRLAQAEAEKEERAVQAERKIRAKAARKARRSRKIKRVAA